MKRHIICIVVASLLSCTALIAQNLLYRVEPGDTFESISKEFGISVTELKEANPNARTLFVGMKINVPEKKKEQSEPTNNVTFESQETIKELAYETPSEPRQVTGHTEVPTTTSPTEVQSRGTEALIRGGGAMFFNKGEMVKKTYSIEYYMGARSYPFGPIFFEYGLGYVYDSSWDYGKDYKFDSTAHSLQVPVLLGVSLGSDIGTNIYFGPYVDFTLASKNEMEIYGEKTTQKLRDVEDYNRFQLGVRFGGELDIYGFILGAYYSIGLTSHVKGVDPSGGKLSLYLAF